MPTRKSIRLKDYDYTEYGYYFITICCYKKLCLLGKIVNGNVKLNQTGLIIKNELKKIHQHFDLKIDTYVIMPNHIHFILILEKGYLPRIIQVFKSRTQKLVPIKLWQRGYYEHIIRNETSLCKLQEYIINNPIKWEIDRENPKFSN